MDLTPLSQTPKPNQHKSDQQHHRNLSGQEASFGAVLSGKAKTLSQEALKEAEEAERMRLMNEKIHVEDGSEMRDDEESEEETIQKLKDKIRALAELERQGRGLNIQGIESEHSE